jgi:4,5-dihydroxyphthalate decarboxylase
MSTSRRTLTAVTRTQGNNADLKHGTVTPEGLTLEFEEVPVLVHAFRRMVREQAFDVCEMALTTYLCAREHGARFTALPIFLVRGFHHGAVVRGADAAPVGPTDLEGRRVGVNRGYTVTTGVWARGILAEEYGVDLDKVTWVPSGDEHVSTYRYPANVDPSRAGTDLRELLATGDVAAGVGITADEEDLVPLISQPHEAAQNALAEKGLYPINHLIVIRDELLEQDASIATAVFDAFAESKQRYVARLEADRIEEPTATDRMYRQVSQTLGGDPLPYGIEPNREMLERLMRHAVDQRIIEAPMSLEDLFAPATHDVMA